MGRFNRHFIQTDAAINPGNSGGYQGIGFALPAKQMVTVYNGIIQDRRAKRGSIGISWNKNEKPEVPKATGYASAVIVAINGKIIKIGDDLVAIVAETPVGNSVKITAGRAGKKLDFHVLVRDRNDLFKDRERFTRHREDIEIGVQERDVIISVNRQPVTSQDNLR